MKIQLVSFVVQGLFFNEVVRVNEHGDKALTSNSVTNSIVL